MNGGGCCTGVGAFIVVLPPHSLPWPTHLLRHVLFCPLGPWFACSLQMPGLLFAAAADVAVQ